MMHSEDYVAVSCAKSLTANSQSNRPTVPHVPFCQIHDEKSFEAFVNKWNQTVVSTALDATQQHLEDSRKQLP